MQPSHVLESRSTHSLDVLRHHSGTSASHTAEGAPSSSSKIFPYLPALFALDPSCSETIAALLKLRAAPSPKALHAEAVDVLQGLVLLNDRLGAIMEEDLPGLLYEGIPLTPTLFLQKVLQRNPSYVPPSSTPTASTPDSSSAGAGGGGTQ